MRSLITALLLAAVAASACQAGGHFRARGFGYGYGYPAAAVVAYPAPALYYAPPVAPLATPACNCGVANALAAVSPAATTVATATTTTTVTQETAAAPQTAAVPPPVSYAEAAPAPSCAPPPQVLIRPAAVAYLAPSAVVVGKGVVTYGRVASQDVVAVRQVARYARGLIAHPVAVFARPAAVVVTPRLVRARAVAAPVVVPQPVSVNATVIRRGLFGRVRSVTNVNVGR